MARGRWLPAGAVLTLLVLLGLGWAARGRFLPVGTGREAPDFHAADLQGRPVSLAQLRGQVVLLNIWATWCPPCRDEMPSMQRLYEQLGPEGLHVVAVSVDAPVGSAGQGGEPGGDVAAFVREYGLGFDIWLDPAARIQEIYGSVGIPESYVLDRDGRVVRKVIGGTDWDSEANLALFRRLLGR